MRTLTPAWPTRSLAFELFDEMDRYVDDWSRLSPSKVYDERAFAPTCDVAEVDDHYLMSLDLPGMKKEDIKIHISDHTLTISGERKRENTEKNHKVQLYEKSYGFFKRSFNLPSTIEADKVEARYEDGVLELYLPKTQAAKPRQIEIQTERSGFFGKLLGAKNSTQEIKNVASTKIS